MFIKCKCVLTCLFEGETFILNIFSFGTNKQGAGREGGGGGLRRRTVLQKTGLAGDSDYQCGPVCNNICALM